MVSSGMLRRVAFVRTDVLEEPIASIIRVTRIDELGTTFAVLLTSPKTAFFTVVLCVKQIFETLTANKRTLTQVRL
jgi:hypothetical protein